MKYRIMFVVKKADNYGDLYKYYTVNDEEGNIVPYETEDLAVLDAKVETLLNGDYSKSDFIIVTVMDYEIDAKINETNE